jgi:hypothetical protein
MKIRGILFLAALVLIAGQFDLAAQSYPGFQVEGTAVNSSTGSAKTAYHLLILDRTRASGSDIGGIAANSVVYKVKHKNNGYLLALYKVSQTSRATLPRNSVVMVDLETSRRDTIREFVDSTEIEAFFTHEGILGDLREIIKSDF